MKLYICPSQDKDIPGPIHLHPCAKAIAALDETGHTYERQVVKGGALKPWTLKGNRDEIIELSGQNKVPILVLDDGEVITGSGTIVNWARSNPADSTVGSSA